MACRIDLFRAADRWLAALGHLGRVSRFYSAGPGRCVATVLIGPERRPSDQAQPGYHQRNHSRIADRFSHSLTAWLSIGQIAAGRPAAFALSHRIPGHTGDRYRSPADNLGGIQLLGACMGRGAGCFLPYSGQQHCRHAFSAC